MRDKLNISCSFSCKIQFLKYDTCKNCSNLNQRHPRCKNSFIFPERIPPGPCRPSPLYRQFSSLNPTKPVFPSTTSLTPVSIGLFSKPVLPVNPVLCESRQQRVDPRSRTSHAGEHLNLGKNKCYRQKFISNQI